MSTLLFSSIRDTQTPISESKYDEIKLKRPSQTVKWSEFWPKRQPGLFGSRNVIIIPFTAVTNNDIKTKIGTHHDERGYGTHETILTDW